MKRCRPRCIAAYAGGGLHLVPFQIHTHREMPSCAQKAVRVTPSHLLSVTKRGQDLGTESWMSEVEGAWGPTHAVRAWVCLSDCADMQAGHKPPVRPPHAPKTG